MAHRVSPRHALTVMGIEGEAPKEGSSAEMARAALVARRFYLEGLAKKEIGSQLGISRFKVARLLELASEEGLVRIEIKSPGGFDLELADRLRARFGLTEAWVMDHQTSNTRDERESLGIAAAPIVSDLIEPGDVIGIGWGRTLSSMVDHLPALAATTVVQLGGGTSMPYGDSAADLPRRLSERFDVDSFLLHGPLFVDDAATARALRNDSAIATTLKMLDRLTSAVIGVGAWSPDHPIATIALAAADLEEIGSARIVAHSLPLFFDSNGRTGIARLQERAIGVSVDQLAKAPRRIAVAGSASKAEALTAVLKSGIVTHLVTDFDAATAVLLGASLTGSR